MFSVRKVRDRIWQWLTPTAWAAWASSTSNPLRSWPHQLRGRINKLVHKSWHSSREAGQILKFFKGCHETDQTHQWLFKRNSEPEPNENSIVNCRLNFWQLARSLVVAWSRHLLLVATLRTTETVSLEATGRNSNKAKINTWVETDRWNMIAWLGLYAVCNNGFWGQNEEDSQIRTKWRNPWKILHDFLYCLIHIRSNI